MSGSLVNFTANLLVKNEGIIIRASLSPYEGCAAAVPYDRQGPLVPDFNGTYILHAANTYGWPTFSTLISFLPGHVEATL